MTLYDEVLDLTHETRTLDSALHLRHVSPATRDALIREAGELARTLRIYSALCAVYAAAPKKPKPEPTTEDG